MGETECEALLALIGVRGSYNYCTVCTVHRKCRRQRTQECSEIDSVALGPWDFMSLLCVYIIVCLCICAWISVGGRLFTVGSLAQSVHLIVTDVSTSPSLSVSVVTGLHKWPSSCVQPCGWRAHHRGQLPCIRWVCSVGYEREQSPCMSCGGVTDMGIVPVMMCASTCDIVYVALVCYTQECMYQVCLCISCYQGVHAVCVSRLPWCICVIYPATIGEMGCHWEINIVYPQFESVKTTCTVGMMTCIVHQGG